MEKLTADNFIIQAMKYYENPQCRTLQEFEEDIKRFSYLKKLFKRYADSSDLKERLILNHIIILYNVFGSKATDMLYYKIDVEYWAILSTFIVYLGYMSDSTPELIIIDDDIMNVLRKI